MITIDEFTYNTPIGEVHRVTLRLNGADLLSFESSKDSADAFCGLILNVGKFKTEAIEAIGKHLKQTEGSGL